MRFPRCHRPLGAPGLSTGRTALAIAFVAPLLSLAGCDLPRDPENTLEEVRSGVLHVGVSEAPPWIIRERGAEPGGIEAGLVRHLAEQLGSDVRWEWGSPAAHVAALERFELDLVVGGHTRHSPLARPVGATSPWYVTAKRHGETRMKKHHHVFFTPPGENGWIRWLDRQLREDSLLVRSLTDRLESTAAGGRP